MKELKLNISSNRRIGNKKGFVLFSSFIILIALVIIVISYFTIIYFELKNTNLQIDNAKAFYIAEGGLNKAIWYLINTAPDSSSDGSWRTDSYPAPSGPDPTDPQNETFSSGAYTIWVEDSGGNILITSKGEVNDSQRIIQQTISVSGGNATSIADSWKEAS